MLRRISPILALFVMMLAAIAHATINDPVLYYTMDTAQISGTTITDSGSGGTNGTLSGSPTTGATGKIGQAITFASASSQYISASSSPGIDTNSFTVACWAKMSSAISQQAFFSMGNSGNNNSVVMLGQYNIYTGISIVCRNDTASGNFEGVSDGDGSTFHDGTWHHWVATKSGNVVTIYRDGVQKGQTTLTAGGGGGTITVNRQAVATLYRLSPALFLSGTLDEVRVYSRVLSSSEVTDLYNYTGSSSTLFRRNLNLRSGSRSPMSLNFHQPTPISPIEQFKTILRRIAA